MIARKISLLGRADPFAFVVVRPSNWLWAWTEVSIDQFRHKVRSSSCRLVTMAAETLTPHPALSGATRTHYDVLNVPSNSSPDTIKDAFHRLARQTHPDRSAADATNFRRVQEAWECLRDPERRKSYDSGLQMNRRKVSSKRSAAIPIEASECHEVHFVVDDDDEGEAALAYACRCGEEIDIAEVSGTEDLDDLLVECPGCSLVYDTSDLRR